MPDILYLKDQLISVKIFSNDLQNQLNALNLYI